MRLIDADSLKSVLNSGGGESVDIKINKSMPLGVIVDTVIQAYRKCLFAELEKAPTAYDVDKVVDRINIIFKHHRATKTVQKLVVETIEAGVSN